MSSDFEKTYVKILHAKERRDRKQKLIDLGDTTAGKVLAAGSVPDV